MENPAYVQVTQKLLLNQSIGNRFNAKKTGKRYSLAHGCLLVPEVGIEPTLPFRGVTLFSLALYLMIW